MDRGAWQVIVHDVKESDTTEQLSLWLFHPALWADSISSEPLGKPRDAFVVVQSLSHVRLFVTPWTAVCQASLSFTIYLSLLKLMSIESWCHPTISSFVAPFFSQPQSFPASGFLQWVGFRIKWPKYWSFSLYISHSNEYSELIFFRIDWFDLLATQGTLKSLI